MIGAQFMELLNMKRIIIIGGFLITLFFVVFTFLLPNNAQTLNNREDEAVIQRIIATTTEAFNRHDAKTFTRYYTPDAELVTVRGERMTGAAEIEKGLTAIFVTRAKSATLKTLNVTIRFIRPDVAVAHVTNEMSGVTNAAGEKLPPHRELSIRVFVKDSGTWRVTAFHNTVINSTQTSIN
jgi:uncharacterized protein (TIGR02246 family)